MLQGKFIKIEQAMAALLQNFAAQTFVENFGQHNSPEDMAMYMEKAFALDQIQRELANEESEFYFYYENEQPLAYLKINFGQAQNELKECQGAELERIYVAKGHQSKGLGAHLIDFVKNTCAAKAKKYLWLGVWEKNERAIAFYEKHGFRLFDKHTFMLGKDKQTDLLMRCPIALRP